MIEKYRVVAPLPVAIPAELKPTTANLELQKDILAKIEIFQQGWGSKVAPSLLGVQPLGVSGGWVKELWFVREGNGALRYEVTATPSSTGGTDFKINGPLD